MSLCVPVYCDVGYLSGAALLLLDRVFDTSMFYVLSLLPGIKVCLFIILRSPALDFASHIHA